MANKTKRIFKVWDNYQKRYVSLGYNSKATWTVFPSSVLKSYTDMTNLEVHEFEVNPVMVAIYDTEHNLIINK